MGKKVREYKSGDFIFAKVKGYPAWPARVQRPNGKKYFVYFYGTGETANLPPNMIFDYSENKDKFLTKTVKRRDFNDGVKQIEYDFANNVPLEEVIGVPAEVRAEDSANETVNDSAIDTTMEESAADTTANDTLADDPNVTQNDAAVEDSDEAGALIIDEGKTPAKGRKAKTDAKAKETVKPAKTPRGKAKKDEPKEKEKDKEEEKEKVDEELVSRSGRKIRPKRYIDEQTEENATLPSPAPKRRRASPAGEKEKADTPKEPEGKGEKTFTQYNVVKQSELEGLKKPFEATAEEDKDKENILIAYLPNGVYAGIRVFQARPKSFKNEAARLQWDKQAARNALTLKMQLEREHITPQSVAGQLVMELNLTDEEKATLDKERETEEKKSRVNFLKTEMKLIELDAKIKTCLCLEKADTELCLKLLDELLGLEVKPLMLLKHPTCLETVKRMRAYVGNTPSWDLSEQDALHFSKHAHTIRKKADTLYKNMKEQFETPSGVSFWEYFSDRVLMFKEVTANLHAGELLELVHEPVEMSQPNAMTMRAAVEEANSAVPPLPDTPEGEDDKQIKKKPAAKSKKPVATSTPAKSRRTRNNKNDDAQDEQKIEDNAEDNQKETNSVEDKEKNVEDTENSSKEPQKEAETTEQTEDVEMGETEKPPENEVANETDKEKETENPPEESEKYKKPEKTEPESSKPEKSKRDKKSKDKEEKPESEKEEIVKEKETEKKDKRNSKEDKNSNNNAKDKSEESEREKNGKEDKGGKEKGDRSEEKPEAEKEEKEKDEPRAKRSRESKKTDPPPRSPAKRKSKA